MADMASVRTFSATKSSDGDDFTVENVLKCIPQQAFMKDDKKAVTKLITTSVFFVTAYLALSLAPWYMLPLAWFYAGTVFTGMYAIAHDCGHNSFFRSQMINTIVGGACFIPILYPLEGWRLRHDLHHKNERISDRDNMPKAQKPKSMLRLANPLFWPYDVACLLLLYFDLSRFAPEEQQAARLSVYFSYMSGPVLLSAIIYNFGIWAFVKFWFLPYVVFIFWKNALRLALPSVLLSKKEQGSKSPSPEHKGYSKYRNGTVVRDEKVVEAAQPLACLHHYKFPIWFEFFCHDINLQIPHYLSTDIPCYNLQMAHDSIMQSRFKNRISRQNFGWKLLLRKAGDTLMEASDSIIDATEAVVQAVVQHKTTLQSADPAVKKLPLSKRLDWLHVPLFVFTHTAGLIGLLTTPWNTNTVIWSVIYYFCTGLGITAGYHRLWAHRAYDAAYPVRLLLMLFGAGAVEGSIKWWCRGHRVHHRYTDSDLDPYNAKLGFWHSHMGWMLLKPDPKKVGKANIDDLLQDPMIVWQHKHYLPVAVFMAFIFPTLVAGLGWGDWWGGYFLAGIVRLCFVHHATFFVNSLAHWLGDHPFADRHSPRDSFVTAILTLGEGYHNFHHEFPKDYRNAIRFYQYDPTKWLIRALAFFGLTSNLHVFPQNEVEKGMLQMKEKELMSGKKKIDWGPEIDALPTYTLEEIRHRKEDTGELWIIIDELVHDVTQWVHDHPGGPALVNAFVGKDATKAFNGGVYSHSNAGHNMLSQLRVGRALPAESGHREPLAEELYEVEYKTAHHITNTAAHNKTA